MSTFGKHIKNLRKIKEMSLRELAEKSGVSHTQISRMESGQRDNPKPDTVQKLANALEVDLTELMAVAGYNFVEIPEILIDENTRRVMENFNKLTLEHQWIVEELIQVLIKSKGDQ